MSYHLLVDPFRTERAEGSNILTCHSFCESRAENNVGSARD
jgi:hypothetical protein